MFKINVKREKSSLCHLRKLNVYVQSHRWFPESFRSRSKSLARPNQSERAGNRGAEVQKR